MTIVILSIFGIVFFVMIIILVSYRFSQRHRNRYGENIKRYVNHFSPELIRSLTTDEWIEVMEGNRL